MAILPGLECQVCDDCVASILSFAQIKKTGVKISYDGEEEMFIVHSKVGDLEFKQRGDLYLADFRPYITDRALVGMTRQEREAMFNMAMVKSAKEAGKFIKNAGYPSEQAAIDLVRSGNITNVPVEVQDIKNYFEIYGTPTAAIRGRTTQDGHITRRDTFDSGLMEQITVQEMVADIMHVAGAKFMVSLASPLQILLVVPTPSMSRVALGRALQEHINLIRMFGFDARIVFVDPLVGLRGSIPGVEVQATGAGDHLPKLDIRIWRVKE